ncbi:MAG: hypothetical protein IJS44_03425 [Clostridia bacterium]|nr:hypothetical protein [Clostridia bacterium]
MGGRGTFASGNPVPYTYETVDKIDGVKVLQPIDKSKSYKLPEEAHSSSSYVLLNKDGVFHQYREYNENHEITLEIGYHHEPSLGKGDVLHIHIHQKPGIDHHNDSTTVKRKLTRTEYERYKSFFKGVTIDERKYFS